MKNYRAVLFGWDGTAVLSRGAPVEDVCKRMEVLLDMGIPLAIISGTVYDIIAGGRLHEHFTLAQLPHLFLGLGRGAYDYGFDTAGQPVLLTKRIPEMREMLIIHQTTFDLHCHLLENYGIETDIIFSRPNYCKLDLLVGCERGDALFMQESEIERLQNLLDAHSYKSGLSSLIRKMKSLGKERGLDLCVTSDAKYIEAGLTAKNTNTDALLELLRTRYDILSEECAFWGDEFISLCDGVYGSDSLMITPISSQADFFDVSTGKGKSPEDVQVIGGGVPTFLSFLDELLTRICV